MPKKPPSKEKLESLEKIKMMRRRFCSNEAKIYNEIIDSLEISVNKFDNFRLEYNGLPLRIGTRKLIKLCGSNINYDEKEYIPFRPLKNHKHCTLILDYIQHNEYENAILVTSKNKIESNDDKRKNKFHFKVELRNGNEVLSTGESTRTEIEAKFKCLYYYLYGDLTELNQDIKKIAIYDRKMEEMVEKEKSQSGLSKKRNKKV